MRSAVSGAMTLVLVVVAGCSGGGGDKAKAQTPHTIAGDVTVTSGAVTVSSAGPPVALDDAVRNQMLDTVKRYIEAATIAPLRTGKAANDVPPLLTTAAAARVAGPDRAVVVDEGFPRATADITATAVPVPITVLVDQSGTLVLATTGLDVTVATRTAPGPVAIHRVGSLTLAPDSGSWKVAGFDLGVTRTGKGVEAAAKVAPSGSSTSSTGGGS
jgi:hypothetical protein